jgi:hypothetical protein
MSSTRSLEKGVMDVVVFIHTELHSNQDKPDESAMLDLADVLKLQPIEAVEFIKSNLANLIR